MSCPQSILSILSVPRLLYSANVVLKKCNRMSEQRRLKKRRPYPDNLHICWIKSCREFSHHHYPMIILLTTFLLFSLELLAFWFLIKFPTQKSYPAPMPTARCIYSTGRGCMFFLKKPQPQKEPAHELQICNNCNQSPFPWFFLLGEPFSLPVFLDDSTAESRARRHTGSDCWDVSLCLFVDFVLFSL